MKYIIYQIPQEETTEYEFMNWRFAQKHGFSMSDYSQVYTDTISSNDPDYILEKLFVIFNQYRPDDFKGHSLSVSDIVELAEEGPEGNIEKHYYYCDRFGWVNITSDIQEG